MESKMNYTRRGGIYCAAQTCSSCSKGAAEFSELSFHTFPKDQDRCREWLCRIGRSDLLKRSAEQLYGNYKLCSRHFTQDMFLNATSKRRRLIWNAMPTENLSFDPMEKKNLALSEESPDASVEITYSHGSIENPLGNDIIDSKCISLNEHLSENSLPVMIVGKVVDEEYKEKREIIPGTSSVPAFIELSLHEVPLRVRNEDELKEVYDTVEECENFHEQRTESSIHQVTSELTVKSEDNPQGIPVVSDYKKVNIMKSLLHLNKKSEEGWTESLKEISFSLFHRFPRDYDFLSSFVSLPPQQSLQDWVHSLYTGTGFQNEVFVALQHRLSTLVVEQRICCLSFHEISVREELSYSSKSDYIRGLIDYGNFGQIRNVANRALVFVVKGIYSKWSQPVGYFLKDKKTSKVLKYLIFECLTKLSQIDLDVKALVCNLSRGSSLLFCDLGISKDRPYITCDGKMVFCLYNPYSLKFNVINMLRKKDIHFHGKVCKWKYFEKYCEYDSFMVQKFTSHMSKGENVLPFSRLYGECFSESVAAGVHYLGALGLSKEESQQTGEFIKKMCDLCRIFNCASKDLYQDKRKCRGNEVNALRESLDWVNAWRVENVKEPILCQEGWILTISGVLQLWEELQIGYNVDYIDTSMLHCNCIRELKLCQHKDSRGKETILSAKQFDSAYEEFVVRHLFIPVQKSKYKDNLTSFFTNFKDLLTICKGMSKDYIYFYHHLEECENVGLPEANRLAFIACHIIRKLRLVVSCKNCLKELTQESQVFCEARESGSQSKNAVSAKGLRKKVSRTMIAPHRNFLKIMPSLESSFVYAFRSMYHMCRVKMKIHQFMYKDLQDIFTGLNLDCEDVKRIIIGLFINISINHIISIISVSNGKIIIPEHL